VSRMAVAAITGVQGDTLKIARHHVMATMKHFASMAAGGRHQTRRPQLLRRIIRRIFWCRFRLRAEQVGSVMAILQRN